MDPVDSRTRQSDHDEEMAPALASPQWALSPWSPVGCGMLPYWSSDVDGLPSSPRSPEFGSSSLLNFNDGLAVGLEEQGRITITMRSPPRNLEAQAQVARMLPPRSPTRFDHVSRQPLLKESRSPPSRPPSPSKSPFMSPAIFSVSEAEQVIIDTRLPVLISLSLLDQQQDETNSLLKPLEEMEVTVGYCSLVAR